MNNWILFYQPHVTDEPRMQISKRLSDSFIKNKDVKSGDLTFLISGNYGLCGWGYITNVKNRDTDLENKMHVEATLRVYPADIISIQELCQNQNLLNIFENHNANFIELNPKEYNALSEMFRNKGIEAPDNIPEIQEIIGKFGVKTDASFCAELELVVETHNLASVLFLDLDNFKSVNDDNNHEVGDQVIREALDEVKTIIAEKGELFHRSGDEMIVLLSNQNSFESMKIAEKIRKGIERKVFSTIGKGIVTTTIGVTTYPDDCKELKQLLKQADEIAMKAKKIKKNSVSNIETNESK